MSEALPAVLAEGLTKVYADGTRAVDGLDLRIAKGEFFGLVGPNGAGKSTTIRMLSGRLRPTSGRAQVLGLDPVRDALDVRARVGVLSEEPDTFERLTGAELLVFTARMHGLEREEAERRAGELMDLLELASADRGRLLADYSLGMRKKTLLGCALIHGPDVLFLDEPFGGIDPLTSRMLRRVLVRLTDGGVTVFFSSHVLEVVELLCERVAVLRSGRLVAQGTLEELRASAGTEPGAPLGDVFLALMGDAGGDGGLTWMR